MRTPKALILFGAASLCMLMSPQQAPAAPESVSATMATAINHYRARHGMPPLEVSDSLAEGAQKWAERGVFEHSPVDGRHGETLYTYSTQLDPKVAVQQAVDYWYDEGVDREGHPGYDYNHEDTREDFLRILHSYGCFAQLVWKETTAVGAGVAWLPDKQTTFVVAWFDPPGNVAGRYRFNVFPEVEHS